MKNSNTMRSFKLEVSGQVFSARYVRTTTKGARLFELEDKSPVYVRDAVGTIYDDQRSGWPELAERIFEVKGHSLSYSTKFNLYDYLVEVDGVSVVTGKKSLPKDANGDAVGVKNIGSSNGVTWIHFTDNTRTLVRHQSGEFDHEKAVAFAIAKRFVGLEIVNEALDMLEDKIEKEQNKVAVKESSNKGTFLSKMMRGK